MTFNLPATKILKRTKGEWSDIQFPTTVCIECQLLPRDYFEPVEREAPRSCVPAGGINFSCFFDANTGRVTLSGETMFQPMSVSFDINEGMFAIALNGRCMRVVHPMQSMDQLDSLLTQCEHVIPTLLSLQTGLAVFCDRVEIGFGPIGSEAVVEARSETSLPAIQFRVVGSEARIDEVREGIEMIGATMGSARFVLACSYFREALFFSGTYYEHNPYTTALITILKCAQAIEVLFGSQYDAIREKCAKLGIDSDVVEREIVRINVVRNKLGPGHASGFVPEPSEAETLRQFALRSTHTVQRLLLLIGNVNHKEHAYLCDKFPRDKEKEELMEKLKDTLDHPEWAIGRDEIERVIVDQPMPSRTATH